MFRPEGVFTAMLTPFTSEVSVNEPELRRMVDFQIAGGVNGLFPVSSVGEGIHMSFDEKCQAYDIVCDQAAGRVPVTPGVASTYPAECIRLAKQAHKAGASAVLATPPYFYTPSPEAVTLFFQRIADESPLPVIIYNIPLFTPPLSMETVARLVRHENVAAMKDSSGNMVDFLNFLEIINDSGTGVRLLTGREAAFLACLNSGAHGGMTAAASVMPEIMSAIYAAHRAGNADRARELQGAMHPLLRLMFASTFPVGAKLAMGLRGFDMGPQILPLSAAEKTKLAQEENQMRALIDDILAKHAPSSR